MKRKDILIKIAKNDSLVGAFGKLVNELLSPTKFDPTIPPEIREGSEADKLAYFASKENYYGEILFGALAIGLIFTYISTKYFGSSFRESFKELFGAYSRGYLDSVYSYPENLFRYKTDYISSNLEAERKRKNFVSNVINELKREGFVKSSGFLKFAQDEESPVLKSLFLPLKVTSNLVGNLIPDFIEKNNVANFFVRLALGLVGLKLGIWVGQKLFLSDPNFVSPSSEIPDSEIRKEYERFRLNSAKKSFLQEILYRNKTITTKDLDKAKDEKEMLNFMKASSYEDSKCLESDLNLLLVNYAILLKNEKELMKMILTDEGILKEAQNEEAGKVLSQFFSKHFGWLLTGEQKEKLWDLVDMDVVVGLGKLIFSAVLGFYTFKLINYVYNYGTTYIDSLHRYLTQSMVWRDALDKFNSSLGQAKKENLFVDYSEPNIELLKIRALEDAGYFDNRESLKARTKIY
jgi:hypothetical protein